MIFNKNGKDSIIYVIKTERKLLSMKAIKTLFTKHTSKHVIINASIKKTIDLWIQS